MHPLQSAPCLELVIGPRLGLHARTAISELLCHPLPQILHQHETGGIVVRMSRPNLWRNEADLKDAKRTSMQS